jgi:hypothetical protein
MTDVARACAAIAAAGMSYVIGEIDAVRSEGDAALSLLRGLDRSDLLVEAAALAASGALFGGHLDAATAYLAEARTQPSDGVPAWAVLHADVAAAQVSLLAGGIADAEQRLLDCEQRARLLGNPFTLATVLNLRATLTLLRDEHAATAELLAEAADLSVASRISWTFAYALPALASVAVRLGDLEAGATLFGAAASWSADHSVDTGFPTSQALAHRDLATAREALGELRFRTAWDAGRDSTGSEVVDLAREVSLRARG